MPSKAPLIGIGQSLPELVTVPPILGTWLRHRLLFEVSHVPCLCVSAFYKTWQGIVLISVGAVIVVAAAFL